MDPGSPCSQSKKDRQQHACQALNNIWRFLENYLPLANTHGADFITQRHWERHVPETWRRELLSLSREQLVLLSQYPGLDPVSETTGCNRNTHDTGIPQQPPTRHNDDTPRDQGNHLSSFIASAARCHLENTSTLSTLSDVVESTKWMKVPRKENDHLSEGMSEKKSHEIEAVSAVVLSLITHSQAHMIIDLGSGKGYLGCELSLRQKIPVIGLDCCDTNTQGALTRNGKLTQRWQKLTNRETKLMHAEHTSHRTADISRSSPHNPADMPDCSQTRSSPHNPADMPDCSQTSLLLHEISNEVSCPSKATSYSETHQKLSGSENWVTIEASPADLHLLEGNACATVCLHLNTASLEDTQQSTLPQELGHSGMEDTQQSTLPHGLGHLGNSSTDSINPVSGNSSTVGINPVSLCGGTSCGGVTLLDGRCVETILDRRCVDASGCSCTCERSLTGNKESRHSQHGTVQRNVKISLHSCRQETVQENVDMSSHSCRQQQETEQRNVDMSSNSCRQETVQGIVDISSHSCRHVSPVIAAPSSSHITDQKTVTPGRSLYLPLTLAVHPDMNLTQILEAHAWKVGIAQPASARILCTGLHACGSLSVTAIKLFLQNPTVVGLCVVGCCYQLMEESCPDAADEGLAQSAEAAHFPLSQVGQQLGLHLGRNARNLASQSVNRMQVSGQLQGADFCWRAMLELLLQELKVAVPQRIVGMRKLHKRCHSFLEYVRAALSKLHLQPDLASPELVASVEDKCGEIRDKLAALVQVKLLLAPVIEAVLLLDRYLYLLEQDCIQDAHIVQLFDPVISPRCFAILAWKSQS